MYEDSLAQGARVMNENFNVLWVVITILSFGIINLFIVAFREVNKLERFKAIFVPQAVIDSRLKILAWELSRAYEEETIQQMKFARGEIEELDHRFGRIQGVVAERKRIFWNAHALAQRLHYKVPSKYREALALPGPMPERKEII